MLLFLLRLNQPSSLSKSLLQHKENEINANVNSSDSLSTPDFMNSTNYSSQYVNSTTVNSFSICSNADESALNVSVRCVYFTTLFTFLTSSVCRNVSYQLVKCTNLLL